MHGGDDDPILASPYWVNIPMKGDCEGRMTDSFCMIMTTTDNEKEADRLSVLLVERRLAACVQVMEIQSTYVWQGKVVREPEYLLQIKTRADLFSEVETVIIENHSYEVPEIIQVPIMQGSEKYLDWMCEVTG